MGDLPVHNELTIKSGMGEYKIEVVENVFSKLSDYPIEKTQFIVDRNVYRLYKNQFDQNLSQHKMIFVDAFESNKNVDKVSYYVKELVENKVKIDHSLIAIGGGITQDITCFLASTLFRGMSWQFVPTTLLAQADSCIGSKSSINVGEFKNLMGTFYPPTKILLDISFLDTLEKKDVLSGIGEILKVHMIKGISYFEAAATKYDEMLVNQKILLNFIWNSLLYKKDLIEVDEYDRGPRNVMNYGHSFGHAIETATNFGLPHGIAVSLGMDMANYQSFCMKRVNEKQFLEWHECLKKNYKNYVHVDIQLDTFLSAISKDKKNIGSDLSLILVQGQGAIEKIKVSMDESFKNNCHMFFNKFYKNQG